MSRLPTREEILAAYNRMMEPQEQQKRIITMSPREYVRLYETNPDAIKDAHIIPPKIGSRGFGKIVVELFEPVEVQRPVKHHGYKLR